MLKRKPMTIPERLSLLGNRLIVRPDPPEESRSGVYIPETARSRPLFATIEAVGSGKLTRRGRHEMPLAVGDRVVVSPWAGKTGVSFELSDGRLMVMLHEILAVVEAS